MRPPRHPVELSLLGLALVPVLLGLGNELQEYDATQYAEVARRMVESGDWLNLRDNFGPFLNKPPLAFWLMGLSFELFGPTSFAVRLPSLLLGLFTLGCTARLGSLLYRPHVGLWAAALVAASLGFQSMLADPKVDMALTACVTGAVWCAVEGRRRRWAIPWTWVFAGLGVLAKGPVGALLPAAALLPEALRARWDAPDPSGGGDARERLWARLGALRLGQGLLLFLAVLAPWAYVVGRTHGADGAYFFVWVQGVGRLLEPTYKNNAGPLFFVHTALWAFLPFWPALTWALFSKAAHTVRTRELEPDARRVLVWWFAVGFVVISLAHFKLPQYLFWLLPPGALLAADVLDRAQHASSAQGRAGLGGYAALLFLVVAAVIALTFWRAFLPESDRTWALWAGAWLAFGAAALAAWRKLSPPTALACALVLGPTFLNLFFHTQLQPTLMRFQPDRELGELARRLDPSSPSLPYYRASATNAAAFYARRQTREVEAEELVQRFAARESLLVVVDERAISELEAVGLRLTPLHRLPAFAVSRPTRAFLDASTRSSVCQPLLLARLRAGTGL